MHSYMAKMHQMQQGMMMGGQGGMPGRWKYRLKAKRAFKHYIRFILEILSKFYYRQQSQGS